MLGPGCALTLVAKQWREGRRFASPRARGSSSCFDGVLTARGDLPFVWKVGTSRGVWNSVRKGERVQVPRKGGGEASALLCADAASEQLTAHTYAYTRSAVFGGTAQPTAAARWRQPALEQPPTPVAPQRAAGGARQVPLPYGEKHQQAPCIVHTAFTKSPVKCRGHAGTAATRRCKCRQAPLCELASHDARRAHTARKRECGRVGVFVSVHTSSKTCMPACTCSHNLFKEDGHTSLSRFMMLQGCQSRTAVVQTWQRHTITAFYTAITPLITCSCARMWVHTPAHAHTHTCTHVYKAHAHACTRTCACARAHARAHERLHARMCAHMHTSKLPSLTGTCRRHSQSLTRMPMRMHPPLPALTN